MLRLLLPDPREVREPVVRPVPIEVAHVGAILGWGLQVGTEGSEHQTCYREPADDASGVILGSREPNAVARVGEDATADLAVARAVADDAIEAARAEVAKADGLLLCPEGAATWTAYRQSLADGRVGRHERAVLFNCATGLKYPLPASTRTLGRHRPIDYARFG